MYTLEIIGGVCLGVVAALLFVVAFVLLTPVRVWNTRHARVTSCDSLRFGRHGEHAVRAELREIIDRNRCHKL